MKYLKLKYMLILISSLFIIFLIKIYSSFVDVFKAQSQLSANPKSVSENFSDIPFPNNLKLSNIIESYFPKLVPYNGPIEHIFFHPLIAWPKRAFDGEKSSVGMDNYMATASECKKLLEELYKNNYVLVDINTVYQSLVAEDGTQKMTRLNFDFPENKKPLVLSLDDVNYYEYMIKDGCNYKLVLDDKKNLATYSISPEGEEVISYDNEVMTIVENFIKQHPDFSFNNARGIIGLTGFDGILGYRTQLNSPNRQSEIEQVTPVISKLKQLGWTFASHSYGHPHMTKITQQKFKLDIDTWKNEVEPLVGKTNVFLYPYGEYLPHTDIYMESLDYLINQGGFNIHLGVSVIPHVKIHDNYIFEVRKNIDGLTLRNRKNNVAHMFDTDYVISLDERQ